MVSLLLIVSLFLLPAFFGVSVIFMSLPGLMSVGCANVPQIWLREVVVFGVCVGGAVCVCDLGGGVIHLFFQGVGGGGVGVVNGCIDQLLFNCY